MNWTNVNVKMRTDQHETLTEIAKRTGKNKGILIREAIDLKIKKENKK